MKRLKWSLQFIIPIYIAIITLIWMFTDSIANTLTHDKEILHITASYIRLETLIIPIRVVFDIVLTTMIILNQRKKIYWILGTQILSRLFFDYFFIMHLQFGILGVAYSSLCITSIMTIIGVFMLRNELLKKKMMSMTFQ